METEEKPAEQPTWFRRGAYNPKGNYTKPPLWHIYVKSYREVDENGVASLIEVTEALCGYEHHHNIILSSGPTHQPQVKTAKLRCSKCSKKAGIS